MSGIGDWLKNPVTLLVGGVGIFVAGIALSADQKVDGFGPEGGSNIVRTEQAAQIDSASLGTLKSFEQTLADIASITSDAVVHIKSMGSGGEGSGFIVRSDGWIVTNDHVVGRAATVTVVLKDGREFRGTVTRADDSLLDIAVVKIDAKDLPALKLADSDQTRVGEFAIAVGAPFGLENTVTIGHVSAKGRLSEAYDPQAATIRGYTGLIQTDAAINPGNSGGPLLNTDGEVIGVNSTILSTTQASAGIGFAIPSNVVAVVAEELIETGKFDRGLIGAYIGDLKPFRLKELGIRGGVEVTRVDESSQAYQAGLRQNDIITRLDGTPVMDEQDLRIELYKKSPGDKVTVAYLRDGKTAETSVTLTEPEQVVVQRPNQQQFNPFGDMRFPFQEDGSQQPPMRENTGDRVRLGVQLREIDATMRDQFRIPSNAQGVVVAVVADDTFAAQIGIKPGDVLTQINETPIRSLQDISEAMESVRRGQSLRVDYVRYEDGRPQSFSLTQPIE